jgi:hypothetical protein
MKSTVRLPPSQSHDRRDGRQRLRRLQVNRFQSWQRSPQPATAPLVRLLRLLTR